MNILIKGHQGKSTKDYMSNIQREDSPRNLYPKVCKKEVI